MDGRLTREELSLLLAGHGRLYSEQLGIRLDGLDRDQLFRWFLASLLFGARIFESVARRPSPAFPAPSTTCPPRPGARATGRRACRPSRAWARRRPASSCASCAASG